jgi:hypothetical protein
MRIVENSVFGVRPRILAFSSRTPNIDPNGRCRARQHNAAIRTASLGPGGAAHPNPMAWKVRRAHRGRRYQSSCPASIRSCRPWPHRSETRYPSGVGEYLGHGWRAGLEIANPSGLRLASLQNPFVADGPAAALGVNSRSVAAKEFTPPGRQIRRVAWRVRKPSYPELPPGFGASTPALSSRKRRRCPVGTIQSVRRPQRECPSAECS